jgi:hypothetical protein
MRLDPSRPRDVASGSRPQETGQRPSIGAGMPIDDYDAIAATVQLYIDGSAEGDAAKLSDAFHSDAQMYGAVSDDRYDEPITEYIKLMGESPGGETLRARSPRSFRPATRPARSSSRRDSGGRCRSSASSR